MMRDDFEIQIGDIVYGVAITLYAVDRADDRDLIERDWALLDEEGNEVFVELTPRDERRLIHKIDEVMA